jgi:capsular exopolysaccharide synthesis family protein
MNRIDKALSRAGMIEAGTVSYPDAVDSGSVSVPWELGPVDASEPASAESREAGLSELPLAAPPAQAEPTMFLSRLHSSVLEKLVVTPEIQTGSVEQYRRCAAVLHLTQAERGVKTIMIASAQLGEGKTLTAINLALTLSESYRRSVLLVDADLRRPTIHHLFQVPNVSGLNDGLKGATDRKIVLAQFSEYLSILPAGKPDPDPMSGLTSERMRRVLTEAATTFDWVLLDTPPLDLLPDAHLLASMVDGVVLVVRAGKTPCAATQRTIDVIGRDRILGVVLNGVERTTEPSDEEFYGYLQGHIAPRRGVLQRMRRG